MCIYKRIPWSHVGLIMNSIWLYFWSCSSNLLESIPLNGNVQMRKYYTHAYSSDQLYPCFNRSWISAILFCSYQISCKFQVPGVPLQFQKIYKHGEALIHNVWVCDQWPTFCAASLTPRFFTWNSLPRFEFDSLGHRIWTFWSEEKKSKCLRN